MPTPGRHEKAIVVSPGELFAVAFFLTDGGDAAALDDVVDGVAGVTVWFGRFARRNHLHPAADGRHGRSAGDRVRVFEQYAVMGIAVTRGADLLQRPFGVAPFVVVGQRGATDVGHTRPDRTVLLFAVAVGPDDRLGRSFSKVFVKGRVEVVGQGRVEDVEPDQVF